MTGWRAFIDGLSPVEVGLLGAVVCLLVFLLAAGLDISGLQRRVSALELKERYRR